MSATDLQIADEALRLCAGSTTKAIALKALKLRADGWVPDPVENLASWLLSNVSASPAAYAIEIREFLANHTKDMLKPDADGWIKTPNGIDYAVKGLETVTPARAIRVRIR